MLYDVTLRAAGITITAEDDDQAERYAMDDARDFMGQWNVDPEVEEADPRYAEAADSADDVRVEVESTDFDGDETYTFTATFRLTVEAESEETAIAAAKAMLAGED